MSEHHRDASLEERLEAEVSKTSTIRPSLTVSPSEHMSEGACKPRCKRRASFSDAVGTIQNSAADIRHSLSDSAADLRHSLSESTDIFHRQAAQKIALEQARCRSARGSIA